MVNNETNRRDQLRAQFPLLSESLVEEDCSEEQYQCCVCKGFCYLSQVICSCTSAVSCIEHANQLCGCQSAKRTLRKRYSENQLEEILSVVRARAAQPEGWRARLHSLLAVARPPLKSMRALLAEGEKISCRLEEVDDLRDLVSRANACVERVTALATRKSTGRRRKGRQDEADDELDRSPQALSSLLKEAERLAFDSPEIMQLRQMVYNIERFRAEATVVLSTSETDLDIDKCQTALILGNSLNIDLPEVAQLQAIVNRLEWFRKVEEEVDDQTLQYEDVVALLEKAEEYQILREHPTVVELRRRETRGAAWQKAAQSVLEAPSITIEMISSVIDGQEMVPVSANLIRPLEHIRKTALNWQASAKQHLLNGNASGALRLCKMVKSASGALSRVRIPEVSDLQDELDYHTTWLKEVAVVLGVAPTKVYPFLTNTLTSAKSLLSPADDLPSDSFSCFCRTSPAPTMVTCNLCRGQYHPHCINVNPKLASHTIRCAMCEREMYDDRPSLHAIALLTDKHKWRFVMPSAEFSTLMEIIDTAVRFARVVLPIADPFGSSISSHDIGTLAHFARKLYNLPVVFDAIEVATNERVIFEDWLCKRIRDVRTPAKKRARVRKPKLVLKESHPHEFYCICSIPPVDQHITVTCSRCQQGYHSTCVKVSTQLSLEKGDKWRCPCCTVKEGKFYAKDIMLRVQMSGEWHDAHSRKSLTKTRISRNGSLRRLPENHQRFLHDST